MLYANQMTIMDGSTTQSFSTAGCTPCRVGLALGRECNNPITSPLTRMPAMAKTFTTS